MVEIFKVDLHFVGPNDIVVIPFWVGLLGEQFFLVAVLDAGGACDAGTELEDTAVVALQLVGITRHIRSRSDETHLSDKDIDELGEAIHLTMTQPMANPRHPWIVGYGNGIALRLHVHSTELADSERFAVFSNAPLHEENRTFRVDFDEDGNEKQRKKQKNKTH